MVSEVPGKQLLLGCVCRETQVMESPADTSVNPITLSAVESSDIRWKEYTLLEMFGTSLHVREGKQNVQVVNFKGF